MKTIISGFGLTIVLIFAILIQSNIINFTSRSHELNNAVNNAVIDTQRVMLNQRYPITTEEEYVAEFTQNLMQYINSDSDITVKVYSAETETGLLDIGVISEYSNLKFGGNDTKKYEVRRTSIIDKVPNTNFNENHLLDSYFMTFQVNTGVQLDLSQLDFFVAKSDGTKEYKIPILGGRISNVGFKGMANCSYQLVEDDENKYLTILMTGIQSDIEITVN